MIIKMVIKTKLQPWEIDAIANISATKLANLEDNLWTKLIDYLYEQAVENKLEKNDDLDWQQQMLNQQSLFSQRISKEIYKIMNGVIADFKQKLQDGGVINLAAEEEWLRSQFNKKALPKKPKTSLQDSKAINKTVSKHVENDSKYLAMGKRNLKTNTEMTLKNLIHTTISEYRNGGKGMTTDKAIYRASRKAAQKGIPMLIDRAGKHWDPEVYTRLVISNALSQVSNESELARFQEYGGKLVRVSSHAACRPTHRPYQDNIYCFSGSTENYKNIREATNYGTAGGLCGINCRHYLIPYIPDAGEFKRPETIDEAENARQYKLTQQQRYLERKVRAAKRQQYSAKKFGDEVDQNQSNQRVRTAQANIRSFVKENNLTRQYQREQIGKK